MSDEVRHGWYSRKAALHLSAGGQTVFYDYLTKRSLWKDVPPRGGSIYTTPAGGTVTVTSINDDAISSGVGWDDVVYVGEITKWVSDAPPIPRHE